MQNWHVSPQCQFSAKCFSGQAWHSVGASALQWLFTAVPGGHWLHIRSSDVTGSRYWYFGGSSCCWKAQEREAVISCRGEKNEYFSVDSSKMHVNYDVNYFFFLLLFWSTSPTNLPVKESSQRGYNKVLVEKILRWPIPTLQKSFRSGFSVKDTSPDQHRRRHN